MTASFIVVSLAAAPRVHALVPIKKPASCKSGGVRLTHRLGRTEQAPGILESVGVVPRWQRRQRGLQPSAGQRYSRGLHRNEEGSVHGSKAVFHDTAILPITGFHDLFFLE
ncbi:MAG: hypothetical protein ACE5F1_02875 [Planctomycetota bacterium]